MIVSYYIKKIAKFFNFFWLGLLTGNPIIWAFVLIQLAICILIYPDPVLSLLDLLLHDGGSGGLNSTYSCSIVDPNVNVSGLDVEATSTATSTTSQGGQPSKSSDLLSRRGLPPMSVDMPSGGNLNSGPATQVKNFIESANESIKLYEVQGIKFRKHISDIKNGSELWYDPQSTSLWKEYIKVVDVLKEQQRGLREEAIKELQRLSTNKKV